MLTGRPFWPPGENGDDALRDTPTEAIAPLWHGATPGEKPHGKLTNHDSLLIRRAAPADGKFAIVCYTEEWAWAWDFASRYDIKEIPRNDKITDRQMLQNLKDLDEYAKANTVPAKTVSDTLNSVTAAQQSDFTGLLQAMN